MKLHFFYLKERREKEISYREKKTKMVIPDYSVEVAFNHMISQLNPVNAVVRGTAALFDGFPVALLAFGVVIGSIIAAFIVYFLIVLCFVGNRAFDTTVAPKEWTLVDDIIQDKYNNNFGEAKKFEPKLVEIRRTRWSGIGHALAIIIAVIIIIFGVYSAFFVCGIDPAILVGLGVVSLGISWGLSPIVVEIVAAIRVHWSGILKEGDDIIYRGTGQKGKVSFMGATRLKLQEIDEEGNLMVHHLGYKQLLSAGFSQYVTGGDKHVYRYNPTNITSNTHLIDKKQVKGRSVIKTKQNNNNSIQKKLK